MTVNGLGPLNVYLLLTGLVTTGHLDHVYTCFYTHIHTVVSEKLIFYLIY